MARQCRRIGRILRVVENGGNDLFGRNVNLR